MNKDNAAQYLPLVQALADGKVVHRTHSISKPCWLNLEEMVFDLPPEHYRIKPEPREWWQVRDCDDVIHLDFKTEDEARKYVKTYSSMEVIHVREVTP